MRDPKQRDRSQKFKTSLLWHSLDLFLHQCCRDITRDKRTQNKKIGLRNSRPVCSGILCISSCIHAVDITRDKRTQNTKIGLRNSRPVCSGILCISSCIHAVDTTRDKRTQNKTDRSQKFRTSMHLVFSGPLLSSMM